MKKQLTSRDIRCTVVASPRKEIIQEKIKEAEQKLHTMYCRSVFADIVTK